MQFKQRTLIIFAGLVWFAIGTFLLTLGLRFIMEALHTTANQSHFSMLKLTAHFVKEEQNGIVLLLTFALLLGFLKGRFVLSKTAKRQVNRILTLPNPTTLKHLYTKGNYILIGLMMGLGMGMRFIPITLDTRGVVDVAVGAALMNGAMFYFRSAINFSLLKN